MITGIILENCLSHVSVSWCHLFMFRFWTYLIVLYFQICHLWLISLISITGKKKKIAILLCLTMPLLFRTCLCWTTEIFLALQFFNLFIICCSHYCSWHCIIHHEYRFSMTLSSDTAMLHWCWPQMNAFPRACRKAWIIIYFVVMLTLPLGMVTHKGKATHYTTEAAYM